MEPIQSILGNIPARLQTRSGAFDQLSMIELERKRAEMRNRERGSLEGFDCPECLNRGYFCKVDDACRRYSVECKCMVTRRSLSAMQRSGLASLLERYTFATWERKNPWHKKAVALAEEYITKPEGKWFMMTGRPGSGKTHLCTAMCGKLMEKGKLVQYALWRDFTVLAKALVNNDTEYRRIVEPLKNAQVLYIDDMFKTGNDASDAMKVTPADINLAFEIINHRYNDPKKLTVISSEVAVGDMLGIDEAVGSRIYERTKDYYLPLGNVENWRMG